jgi:hypothetical protein
MMAVARDSLRLSISNLTIPNVTFPNLTSLQVISVYTQFVCGEWLDKY